MFRLGKTLLNLGKKKMGEAQDGILWVDEASKVTVEHSGPAESSLL